VTWERTIFTPSHWNRNNGVRQELCLAAGFPTRDYRTRRDYGHSPAHTPSQLGSPVAASSTTSHSIFSTRRETHLLTAMAGSFPLRLPLFPEICFYLYPNNCRTSSLNPRVLSEECTAFFRPSVSAQVTTYYFYEDDPFFQPLGGATYSGAIISMSEDPFFPFESFLQALRSTSK
jgi:hypothetical protein